MPLPGAFSASKREIIDPKFRKTKNNRKLCEGICVECEGKVALMGGYADLSGVEVPIKNE